MCSGDLLRALGFDGLAECAGRTPLGFEAAVVAAGLGLDVDGLFSEKARLAIILRYLGRRIDRVADYRVDDDGLGVTIWYRGPGDKED
jgi:hypothetical protein